MHDRRLPGAVEPVQLRHRRIEGEETVELERRVRSVGEQRLVAAQPHPIGIADRRHGGKPVERAAQDDGEEARVAPFGARDFRQIDPGEQRARSEQQFAAGSDCRGRRVGLRTGNARNGRG